MAQHPNARLTPRGRLTLVSRVEAGERVADVARQMGVSARTARKWVARHRSGEGLEDRPCAPRSCPRRTAAAAEALVCRVRAERRCSCLELSRATGVPARTCSRIVRRNGLPRLCDLDPVTGEPLPRGPVTRVRYERERPGDLVHVDVKKLPTIPDGGGSRARGPVRREHAGSGRGMVCLHVAVDDRSRACYAELLADERGETCAAFMRSASAFFASLGVVVRAVMTDNGPGYRSRAVAEWAGSEGVAHLFTRPYSPWQNGKVERMNRTLDREWARSRPWSSQAERDGALAGFLRRYNYERPHSACGGLPPMSRIGEQRLGA